MGIKMEIKQTKQMKNTSASFQGTDSAVSTA